jgi:hypothetical protein
MRRGKTRTLGVMVRPAIASVGVLLASTAVVAMANDRPTGSNCNLTVPPPSAGEETNHGVVHRIYPRAKDIGPAYTGCQVLMVPDNGKWVVIMLTEIIKRDPVRIWSEHENDPARLACRFQKGKLVQGNPDTCPSPRSLLLKSMAPGCVERWLAAPLPPECEYQ